MRKVIAFQFLILLFVLGTASLEAVAKSTVHTIVIKNMKFTPDTIEVRKGDVIVWKNEDIVPHTATSQGNFDSNSIAPDASFKKKMKKAGHFDFACKFHPIMKGRIDVK